MTAGELLKILRQRGIRIWLEGSEIRWRAPKGRITPEIEQQCRALKAELVAILRTEVISHRSRGGSCAVSFAQERLWFVDQFEPDSSLYNIWSASRLLGEVDEGALLRAFDTLVARHESLRTTFEMVDGAPVQRIHEPRVGISRVEDVSNLDDASVVERARREASTPFDLQEGPLFRVVLLRRSDLERILVVTMHHIVSDGWSMDVLTRETRMLYDAFRKGEPNPLAELEIQYADFAVWQREYLSGERLVEHVEFWKELLNGAPQVLELPTDRARPATESHRGALLSVTFSNQLIEKLRQLAREQNATLFMVLLASYGVLLGRHANQKDLIVGTPIANRTRSELEPLIGFFVNTLAMRVRFDDDPTFVDLLARVKRMTLDAFEHQDFPFEKLVEALNPVRDTSRSPLFQTMLALQNAPSKLEMGEPVALERTTARFDLTTFMTEVEGGACVDLEYNTDLFDRTTIARLVDHWSVLLEAICENPKVRCADLPLLPATERNTLLVEWNATRTDYAKERCVHELFEAQVDRTPDAIALVFDSEQLTYRQLDERANQVAYHLRALGVGPDVLVGICVERSLAMMVGLLGILKSGGAYVPMDPAYPRERLSLMIEDSGARFVVTEKRWADRFVAPIFVDALDAAPTTRLENLTHAQNLAYAIYTSGSTGRPKGVMVPHRTIGNFLIAMDERVGTDREGVWLAVTSVSFDISVLELFWTLTRGFRVVIHPELVPGSTDKEPRTIAEQIQRHRVTHLQCTPSLCRMEMEGGGRAAIGSLKKLLLGGEALPTDLARQVKGVLGGELLNMYGPTETTIWSSSHEVKSSDAPVPIGRPVANTQMYVVDAQGNAAPVGVAGELLIGGEGVARGYLNRPQLTAERFVPDRFGNGARLYRTGDLARWRPDGTIEFLGRIDHQVKIRGFRIELGEIESQLLTHSSVREAIVLAREDLPGDKRLVAYVTANGAAAPNGETLRDHLKTKLPEHMVPSAWMVLEKLPLTPNGKIDRNALPAPETADAEAYVAPRTALEERLCAIFADVLGAPRVGIHDNFFALGGHSLMIGRLLNRIREQLAGELRMRTLFDRPTVAGVASELEARRSVVLDNTNARPPLLSAPRDGPIPASFAQEDHWLFEQIEGADTVCDAIRLRGPFDHSAFEASLTDLATRQEILRTTLTLVDEHLIQIVHADLPIVVPLVDLQATPSDHRDEEVDRVARAQVQQTFDLSRGPLLRMTALQFSADDHVVVLTVHHAAFDALSLPIFWRELLSLYESRRKNVASVLAPLPIQYADYASWQRSRLRGEALEHEIGYWKKKLAHAPYLEIPMDRPRPPQRVNRGAGFSFSFDATTSRNVRRLATTQRTTTFSVLLAAVNALLSRYSGQEDIVIGTTLANRPITEVESLLGPFISGVALRADLSGAPTAGELVRRMHDLAVETRDHIDAPFARIVRELNLPRDLSRTPLYQLMFILTPSETESLSVENGAPERVSIGARGQAPFDISLWITEEAERLRGYFEYSTALFDASTMERMAAHLEKIVAAMTANPSLRVHELPLLSDDERRRTLSTNATETRFEEPLFVHARIEAQAAKTPDAIAVAFEKSSLTYRELNERANQLAHSLREQGVGPDVLVGVCLERSLDLVVALLAILKAGGAYVPLDPSYPPERLRFMIADASVTRVITERNKLAVLEGLAIDTIFMTEPARSSQPKLNLSSNDLTGDHLAYAIYTSGSTGQPKGALNTHSAIRNRLCWMQREFALDATDVVLQKTPFSFDVSVWEFFWPLMFGAKLVVAPPDVHRDPRLVAQLIAAESVTTLHFVPSMLGAFLEEVQPEQCKSLRRVMCSGEALTSELTGRFFEKVKGIEIHNLYGPTEAAIDVSWWRCDPSANESIIPIGRPIANTRLYVLDRWGQLVVNGAIGELYIGGVQLARGYLNRSGLTAERFVPDPFGAAGSRMYRTGDLARHRSDGNIEFLGRMDHQVKVRGFRIELGEVEAVLAEQSGVREAVMIAREGQRGDTQLVAYVVPSGEQVDVPKLRKALATKLPEYMVPAAFVVMNALPLTPNGKIDRKGLPAPDFQIKPQEFVAPRTATERRIAEIWCEVLGVERVAASDDFFAVGGHSLLAARMLRRVRSELGVDLPLRVIFEGPTVAELASRIDRGNVGVGPPLRRSTETGHAPLSPEQHSMWSWQVAHPLNHSRNVVFGCRLRDALDRGAIERAVDDAFRRHEILRTRFELIDSEPMQVVMPARNGFLEHIDASSVAPENRATWIETLADELWLRPPSFDRGGSIFRAMLVQFTPSDHVLVIAGHHIALDLPHTQQFFREVLATYDAYVAGKPSPMVDLSVQYTDYARWRRQKMAAPDFAPHREYWRGQMTGRTPLALPFSYPPPAKRTGGKHQVVLPLEASTFAKIEELARIESVGHFVVAAAVLQAFLGRITGSNDVSVIALSDSARLEAPELAAMIGPFLDFLVLRTKLESKLRFRDLLPRVGETVRDAHIHSAVPAPVILDEPGIFDQPYARVILNLVEEWRGIGSADHPGAEATAERFGPRVTELAWTILMPDRLAVLATSSDTFDREASQRLATGLVSLLNHAIAEPDTPIEALRIE